MKRSGDWEKEKEVGIGKERKIGNRRKSILGKRRRLGIEGSGYWDREED